MSAHPLLQIVGLTKSFGSNQVLKSVDLDVVAGEVVTVIGPSGGGKTTLLRCVNFLEDYDGGSVKIDGREVGYVDNTKGRKRTEVDLAAMRAETGMVFQSFNLFPHLTAEENVMLGPRRVLKKPLNEARDIARLWLDRVGLAQKANSLPSELSGGQQQRVGIARAVALGPKILLLDEITSALDPELVHEVLDVVRELAADGMTMLIVTHEIGFARDASDRIVFMTDGTISAQGTPPALMAQVSTNERLRTFLSRFSATAH